MRGYSDFQRLNKPCIPVINSTWLWYIILFLHCCFQLLIFYYRFCISFPESYLFVAFCFECLLWFWYRVMLASKNRLENYYFCFFSLKEILQNWHNVFLKCLVEFNCEPIWPWCFMFLNVINYQLNTLIDKWVIHVVLFHHVWVSAQCISKITGLFN